MCTQKVPARPPAIHTHFRHHDHHTHFLFTTLHYITTLHYATLHHVVLWEVAQSTFVLCRDPFGKKKLHIRHRHSKDTASWVALGLRIVVLWVCGKKEH